MQFLVPSQLIYASHRVQRPLQPGRETSSAGVLQMWVVPSLAVYLLERTARWFWPAVNCTSLVDVQLMPGKERVICLRVAKPVSFHYRCDCVCPTAAQPRAAEACGRPRPVLLLNACEPASSPGSARVALCTDTDRFSQLPGELC